MVLEAMYNKLKTALKSYGCSLQSAHVISVEMFVLCLF